jgi:CheY-like chemotaxis protein
MESIEAITIDVIKSKILIYEDQVYSQIALEHILFNELKLKNRISFYNSGITIAGAIRTLFTEENRNQVALIILDYKMPGMNGIELIKWIKFYLNSKGVAPEDMPKFAFRAQQFWELSPGLI